MEEWRLMAYPSCSRLRRRQPGSCRNLLCRLLCCCSCWHSRAASSLPPRTRADTGTCRWCRVPGPSNRSDTCRPCSPHRWRTPHTHTRRRCTGPDPSSLKGTVVPSSCLRQSHGRTRTPLPHTPPALSSRPGSVAQSNFCRPIPLHRCSRRGQSWSCHDRCSLGQNPNDLRTGEILIYSNQY